MKKVNSLSILVVPYILMHVSTNKFEKKIHKINLLNCYSHFCESMEINDF